MSPSSSRSLPARAGCIDPNGDDRKSKSREATLKLDDPAARQARFLVWRETLLKSIFKQPADTGPG
jgi:hypothetical protein